MKASYESSFGLMAGNPGNPFQNDISPSVRPSLGHGSNPSAVSELSIDENGVQQPPANPTPRNDAGVAEGVTVDLLQPNVSASIHLSLGQEMKTEQDMRDQFAEGNKPSVNRAKQGWLLGKKWAAHNWHPTRFFPIYKVLKGYKKGFILPDMVTGLSEGCMAVPQGMSYAMLANLDPIYGLYCGLIYPPIYLIFGTSPQCSFGVSAIEAVLVAESIDSTIGEGAPKEFRLAATLLLTAIMGSIFLAMRLANLGLLADFLADPVLSGFSTASALVIASKQFKYLFGIDEVQSNWMVVQWWELVSNIHRTNWLALILGVGSIIVLVFFKWLNKRVEALRHFPIPGTLVCIIISTFISWVFKIDQPPLDVDVVGFIPAGLPRFTWPWSFTYPTRDPPDQPYEYTLGPLGLQLLPNALALCFIYFVIHISTTKTIAKLNGIKLDNDQELVAMGIANFVGSLISCFPNATSLSRTSVNHSIGVQTVLHNAPYSALMLLTLLVLTRALYHLPMTILAAIVIVGVWSIMDFKCAERLWRLGGVDFWIWLTAFLVTSIFGAMAGVIGSVALSIIWLLKKSARPTAAILGRLPGTTVYRSLKRFPMAIEYSGIKIFRFDASLNFSNADFFEDKIKLLAQSENRLKVLVIDASSINDLDVTAVAMFDRVYQFYSKQYVQILFANWKGPMREFLEKAEFYDIIPEFHCFLSLHDAVLHARMLLASDPFKTPIVLSEADVGGSGSEGQNKDQIQLEQQPSAVGNAAADSKDFDERQQRRFWSMKAMRSLVWPSFRDRRPGDADDIAGIDKSSDHTLNSTPQQNSEEATTTAIGLGVTETMSFTGKDTSAHSPNNLQRRAISRYEGSGGRVEETEDNNGGAGSTGGSPKVLNRPFHQRGSSAGAHSYKRIVAEQKDGSPVRLAVPFGVVSHRVGVSGGGFEEVATSMDPLGAGGGDSGVLVWDGLSAQEPMVCHENVLGTERQWIVYTSSHMSSSRGAPH
eukprot:GHVN01068972.1.p1 GENE.GHVN01068972.1~~GHVN01068972.1.p1  ORF type:complete len:987 (+),score=111.58 GHVN01068972.1:101-3061(+)